MKMRASIAKLGMETTSFTAREFADELAEEERIGAAAIRNPGSKSVDTRPSSDLVNYAGVLPTSFARNTIG
jgi:hypothetical protein